MSEHLPPPCYPELPAFQKKAVRVTIEFSSALATASEFDSRDDIEEAETEACNEMISHIEALQGDAYYQGAAVVLGIIGMAEAIRGHHPCIVGNHYHWRGSDCFRCGAAVPKRSGGGS